VRPDVTNSMQPEPTRSIMGHDGVPVRRTLAPLVRRLQQICMSMIAEALSDVELQQLEFALLVFVDDVPGISQITLSEALGIDRNNVSLLVDKLEARGLLKRSVNDADRRARELYITPAGKRLWRQCLPKIREANSRILASLKAADRKLFLDMLLRVVDANKVHARPGGGRRKRGSIKPAQTVASAD
jgi:DNA-binding MarR family transcriptional regulator